MPSRTRHSAYHVFAVINRSMDRFDRSWWTPYHRIFLINLGESSTPMRSNTYSTRNRLDNTLGTHVPWLEIHSVSNLNSSVHQLSLITLGYHWVPARTCAETSRNRKSLENRRRRRREDREDGETFTEFSFTGRSHTTEHSSRTG